MCTFIKRLVYTSMQSTGCTITHCIAIYNIDKVIRVVEQLREAKAVQKEQAKELVSAKTQTKQACESAKTQTFRRLERSKETK